MAGTCVFVGSGTDCAGEHGTDDNTRAAGRRCARRVGGSCYRCHHAFPLSGVHHRGSARPRRRPPGRGHGTVGDAERRPRREDPQPGARGRRRGQRGRPGRRIALGSRRRERPLSRGDRRGSRGACRTGSGGAARGAAAGGARRRSLHRARDGLGDGGAAGRRERPRPDRTALDRRPHRRQHPGDVAERQPPRHAAGRDSGQGAGRVDARRRIRSRNRPAGAGQHRGDRGAERGPGGGRGGGVAGGAGLHHGGSGPAGHLSAHRRGPGPRPRRDRGFPSESRRGRSRSLGRARRRHAGPRGADGPRGPHGDGAGRRVRRPAVAGGRRGQPDLRPAEPDGRARGAPHRLGPRKAGADGARAGGAGQGQG